jgi:hypothetical protein
MSDPIASPPQGPSEPVGVVAPEAEDAAAGPPQQEPRPTGGDHHGLIAFLGSLALILLFGAAVGAAWSTGASDRDEGSQAVTPGQGRADGQQKRADKAERKAQRQAERQERKAERQERKARLREQLRQRHLGVMGPQTAEALTEQRGTVATQVVADGATVYTLQTASGTLVLDVGPAWFWGEDHPLAPFVGQTVTVTGLQESGSDRFAVYTVNGEVLRGPGRPPWAGGWKVGGQKAPTTSPGVSASPSPGPSVSPTP